MQVRERKKSIHIKEWVETKNIETKKNVSYYSLPFPLHLAARVR